MDIEDLCEYIGVYLGQIIRGFLISIGFYLGYLLFF